MNDIYVYDRNLTMVGIIDTYKSLICASRYHSVGDCELYVRATAENVQLLQKNFYIVRPDDNNMVCQIKKIEIETDVEEGNYIIVTGYDVKRWLDQRIIWGTANVDGNLEEFIRKTVDEALGSSSYPARKMTTPSGASLLYLGNVAGFTEAATEQINYANIGEKVREYCLKYGWGYRVRFERGAFWFELYQGADRTASVIFSDDYENLITTRYTDDETGMGNIALVAGEGEGSNRLQAVSGNAESTERYEIYADAKDISRTITWQALTEMYPPFNQGGAGHIAWDYDSGYVYKLDYCNIQVIDTAQLDALRKEFPDGKLITIDGNSYYQIYNAAVADLPSAFPDDSDSVTLRDVIYSVYLLARGYDTIAEYGAVTSFEGNIEPTVTFVYGRDYYLGDKVTIQNEYGITVEARIVEVVEINDENGYSVQPKFEYISIK